ncbi:MAG TPA: putative hydroxymethylpyrimidine transporter CytX, partial [Pseudomonas sp.]|nr:putative hydroxymethylpyrimidine transporter CytX [Pseudomonas sp.]
VFAPLFGVVLVDHFILRRRSHGATTGDCNRSVATEKLRWMSLLAWLGGISTYHVLANLYPNVGATLPALIVAGVLQLILSKAISSGRGTVPA